MERVAAYLDRQVARRGSALALEDSLGTRWTYADLSEAADALADRLRHQGVRAGDRVMIVSENCGAKLAALFGAWRAGATAVPVNARQTAHEIDRVLAHARPAVVWLTRAVSSDASAHAARLGADDITGPFGTLAEAQPHEPEHTEPDVAVILYTTGTTGDPKGVMLTHDNLRFGGQSSAAFRGITERDLIYGVLPTTHVFGLCSIIVAAVHSGAALRLVPRFDVPRVFDALRDGITLFSAVPQMHAQLMAHARGLGLDRLGANTLRYVSSGAAPLDPTWKREAEAFYGVAVQNGYGMTETTAGTCVTNNTIGDPDISVGRALPDTEVRIDETVPGGGDRQGEVLARGPNVMKGYFRNPEDTARVLTPDGWLRTGDLGAFDEQGRLHILGRSKELIIHGGFNVYPPEVEAALNDHPEVIQAAVVGRQVQGDEEVLAFCQVAPGCTLTESALRAYAAERLAGYKCPKRIILAQTLPAAVTGKILKHKLTEAFADVL